jgi:hypothetical protein
MEEISTTNISTTECGHTYHFQCLYTWTRTHTNCPLCRTSFGEPEPSPEDDLRLVQVLMQGMGRTIALAELPQPEHLRSLNQTIRRMNEERPLEEFTGEIDDRDIALVVQQTGTDRDTAYAYLRYHHGDLVNAILCLVYNETMPIPPFRNRERPAEGVYVSPIVLNRIVESRNQGPDRGYESS